jgi:hypothetical protein
MRAAISGVLSPTPYLYICIRCKDNVFSLCKVFFSQKSTTACGEGSSDGEACREKLFLKNIYKTNSPSLLRNE